MTDNPYAMPVEDLLDSARVPLVEQVVEQPERRFYGGDDGGSPGLFGDGGLCVVDGE